MRRFTLTLTLFMVMFLTACFEEYDAPSTGGTISGVVSDSHTGQPIFNAEVTLSKNGDSFVTGNDGFFEFRGVSAGSYILTIEKVGYETSKAYINVEKGKTSFSHVSIDRIPDIIISDRNVIDFGGSSTSTLSFSIVNPNYQELSWEISHNCPWIKSVSPSSGQLAYNRTETIVVTIDRSKLKDGNNEAAIILHTTGMGYVEVKVKAYRGYEDELSVSVEDVETLSSTSVQFTGYMLTDVSYSRRGFVYGTSTSVSLNSNTGDVPAVVNNSSIFTANATNLQIGKTYYVRAYAESKDGNVVYSSNYISFSTKETSGEVEMDNIYESYIDLDAMRTYVSAYISRVGDPAYSERGFVYSTTNPTPTISDSKVKVAGSGEGSYSAYITNITVGHTYHVRAYLKYSNGSVVYSNTEPFTVNANDPVVSTRGATNISDIDEYATFNGYISDAGYPSYTECGFVYSNRTSMPTVSDSKVKANFTGVGSFSVKASYLDSSSTLYYRAYVKNESGVFYGEIKSIYNADFVVLPEVCLAVQRHDIGKGTWSSINSKCNNSTTGGYSDWRLPTIDELSYILEYSMQFKIGNFNYSCYWSKTSADGYGSYYYCDYIYGIYSANGDDEYYGGRAVRTMSYSELQSMGYR